MTVISRLQIYKGCETAFSLSQLLPRTEYLVRVCAIRQCDDGTGDLIGAFSPGVSFITVADSPVRGDVTSTSAERPMTSLVERKPLTDEQWAAIILAGFILLAIVVSFAAKQILSYINEE